MDEQKQPGLANQALLDKIDKLRELNVGSLELPQVQEAARHDNHHLLTHPV